MARRKSILIKYVFSYDASTAIPIYLQNFIKSLNTLRDDLKPTVYLYYTDEAPINDVQSIGYPYLVLVRAGYWGPLYQRIINKLVRVATGNNYIYFHGIHKSKIDLIFPHFGPIDPALKSKTVAWITDFQPHYYPDFFPADDLERIMRNLKLVTESGVKLVLSSHAAFDDYKKFYPNYTNKVTLLRFVSILPKVSDEQWPSVKEKFQVNKPYFIVSNQFWPHKNHTGVIEALALLNKKYNGVLPFELLITGKPYSHRNPKIFEELTALINQNGLQDSIRFLGFLERSEQVLLIKNAHAVIQPSFFEGWSTLVEECKALNKYIILSNLPVHLEQMDRNVSFFDPFNVTELAEKIDSVYQNLPSIIPFQYEENMKAYAQDVLNLFD